MRSVCVRQAEHHLRCAEDEKAVAFGDVRDRRDDLLLGGLVEVDQDVSAEHDIEAAKGACILQQVEMPEADHRPEGGRNGPHVVPFRSEEHTSELQSLMRISYAVFCLKKKKH